MKPKYEVADIFCRYVDEFRAKYATTENQRKVMAAIMACRTSILGGHSEVCDHCGAIRNSYNSCRNRHCPKCQTLTKEEWLEKRREELLPCGYFHLVFTLPHEFNPLIRLNRRALLTALFTAVKETLMAFAADPQWKLGGKPGILTVLHTWSQTLIDHYHLHCLVPAGVLTFDSRKWVASNDNFLFRVESLGKEFKKRYCSFVEKNRKQFTLPENSAALITGAGKKTWIVYAKKPFAGPEQVLNYLGRYTHRIAISNHRIKSIDNGKVIFTYKDRRNNNESKTMCLDAVEFIRRFLLHVLPKRFMKIRYYGFLANICKKKSVLLIRRLIGTDMATREFIQETIREKVLRLTGKDILLCPHCKLGTMEYLNNIPSLNSG
jgi:hypothetical protein